MFGQLKLHRPKNQPDVQQLGVVSPVERGRAISSRSVSAHARLSEVNAIRSARMRGIGRKIPSQAAPDIATALSGLPAALAGITSAVPGLNLGLPAIPRHPGGLISWAVSKLTTMIKTALLSVIRGFRMRHPFWFYGILIALILIILYPILGTLGILFGLVGWVLEGIGGLLGFLFGLFASGGG